MISIHAAVEPHEDLMVNKNTKRSEYIDKVELFNQLLDSTEDLLLVTDAKLRLVFVSRTILDATDISSEYLIGRTVAESGLFDEYAQTLHESLLQAAKTTNQNQLEIDFPQADTRRIYRFRIQVDIEGDHIRYIIARARDVSEQRRIEHDLREREREFRTLAENSPDNIIRYGPDMRAIYCNREIKDRVSKTSSQNVVGHTPSEAAPAGMRGVEEYEKQLAHTLATGESGSVELIVPHPNGELLVHSVVIAAEHDACGSVCGAVAVGRDVTEQVQAQQALLAKEREFRTLAENAGDNIVRYDTQGRLLYANPAVLRLFNVSMAEMTEQDPTEVLSTRSQTIFAHNARESIQSAVAQVTAEGSEVMKEFTITPPGAKHTEVHEIRFMPERDESGNICSVLGIGRDISEKLEHLKLIESLVSTDPLTRLGNRQALQERAPGILQTAQRRQTQVAVMLLDLDEFKSVNDTMGHSAGDKMLCEVARRLSGCLRTSDLLVRLGGDEFVIVAADIDDIHQVGVVAAKLHDALALPLRISYREIHCTASIGVALYPRNGEHIEQLLANADTAMYQAKRTRRARTEYYREELGESVRSRLEMEEALRKAWDGTDLELYLQPQLDLHEPQSVIGAEALLRWRHPTHGFLTPDKFITLAEETGAIVRMGRWVLRTAAETAVRLNQGRERPLHIAVNVSTRQFIDDDLPAVIDAILAWTGCNPNWLWIELTESALLEDSPRVQQTLEVFHQRGLRIALDDFGTGYSALNYLARFPVDCLKIDRSFVHGIGRSHRDDELVKAFIAMANALNLMVIAEGVETAEQEDFLLAQECTLAQGFRFGLPMPEEQFVSEMFKEKM